MSEKVFFFLCMLYMYTFPGASFGFFCQLIQLGSKLSLQKAQFWIWMTELGSFIQYWEFDIPYVHYVQKILSKTYFPYLLGKPFTPFSNLFQQDLCLRCILPYSENRYTTYLYHIVSMLFTIFHFVWFDQCLTNVEQTCEEKLYWSWA